MSSVLDRLTGAMSAAASTVREEDLRPLTAPERPRRRRRRPAWAVPLAAAAAVVLVIGLAVSVSHGLAGTSPPGGPGRLPAAPLRFYVTTDLAITKIVVRSTATGKVAAVVPVKPVEKSGSLVAPALATGANGTFYVAAFERGVREEQIYRFRLTAAGHVTGFARVPGALRPGWAADALAASADGSRIAVGAYYYPSHVNQGQDQSDQVVVINTRSGAQRIWRGGSLAGGHNFFRVASLSWTGGRRELAVLGQWCRTFDPNPGGEDCSRRERQAQLRAINPAGPGGGTVLGGALLLRQAPRTFLAQALVSPDGSVITAMVLRDKIVGNPQISGGFPANLSVQQVSAATGHQLAVIYRRYLGDTSIQRGFMSDPLTLVADATGNHLILNGGVCNKSCTDEFNGWLHAGRLVPLLPTGLALGAAAEAW